MGTLAVESQKIANRVVESSAAEQPVDVDQKMNALWTEHRPLLLQRVDMLEREFWNWIRSPEEKAAAVIARDLAHKMAGVLGTFGMKRGSMIASSLEKIAGMPRHGQRAGASTVYALLSELRSVIQARR
jgi:HPt (histidine-containing phosphotransfer) domain-containing protein